MDHFFLYIAGGTWLEVRQRGVSGWTKPDFQPVPGWKNLRRAEVPVEVIKSNGEIRTLPQKATQGIYLTPVGDPPADEKALRRLAIAYWIRDPGTKKREVTLSLSSHRVVVDRTSLKLDDEVFGTVSINIGTPGVPQPTENIRTTIRSDGDRLLVDLSYRAPHSVGGFRKLELIIRSRQALSALEVLNWKTPASLGGQMLSHKLDKTSAAALSMSPFTAIRRQDGSYIGVLDSDTENLVVEADPETREVRIQRWVLPKSGESFRWKFQVTAGYEPYANALLRAFEPLTAKNTNRLPGAMSGRLRMPDVESQDVCFEELYQSGVRNIWFHGWFHRNGLYFLPDQPMDREYTSIWKEPFTYNKLKEFVESAHNANLKIFIYFQFAGVSEDIQERFIDSLVHDESGHTIAAGQDGGIRNLWTNPDIERSYGKSVLMQIDRLLSEIPADGIALDRTDRLDGCYGMRFYDFGVKGNAAAPFTRSNSRQIGPRKTGGPGGPESRQDWPVVEIISEDTHPPVSSLTLAGKAFFQELRKILDKHGARLISNLAITPVITKFSDGVLVDQKLNPWEMLFLKATTNGKALFTLETTDSGKLDSAVFFADLFQVQPYKHESGNYPGDATPPRLLYTIPDAVPYPSIWLFSDGSMSRIQYQDDQPTVAGKYRGSLRKQ